MGRGRLSDSHGQFKRCEDGIKPGRILEGLPTLAFLLVAGFDANSRVHGLKVFSRPNFLSNQEF